MADWASRSVLASLRLVNQRHGPSAGGIVPQRSMPIGEVNTLIAYNSSAASEWARRRQPTLLDAGVADHPGPALRLFLLELRHVRRAAATGQKMQLPVSFLDLRVALTARLSLAMMAAGVFGGALMAFQV